MEREVQQQEDQSKRQRDYDHEALLGAFLILVLTTKNHAVAGWQVDLFGYALLQFRDNSTHVTVFDVSLDYDPALYIITSHLMGARLNGNVSNVTQP